MPNVEMHSSNLLNIEVTEDLENISISLTGRSIDENPGEFIIPILSDVLQDSRNYNKMIIMDFFGLEYMNSSTITPFTKILERAKVEGDSISIIYNNSKKWQELCFSALKIFETKDKRIQIKGKKVS